MSTSIKHMQTDNELDKTVKQIPLFQIFKTHIK